MLCSAAAKIDKSASCTCASACFLIWAGGVARSGNDIHIHRISFDKEYYGALSPNEAATKYQEALLLVSSYLDEMEIPKSIYEAMVSMPSYGAKQLPNTHNFTWPPSFSEWLTARCGPPTARRDSTCELQTQWAVSRDAIRKFRSKN
jgi:hypothetical protein